MGMFSRISDIVQSNINAILDKAEDPQKVIRLIIQEMEETMVEVRSLAAKHIADKKVISRQLAQCEKKVCEWQANAELAMSKGREDLARSALAEKHHCQQKQESLQQQVHTVDELISQLQNDTAQLQSKMAEARAKQQSMVARTQSATVRLKAKAQVNSQQMDNVIARFEHYERRVDELEAQVEAYDLGADQNSVAAQFRELEEQDRLDAELAALKKKVA
ncbi:phage shock protein PspA [Alteromonadaceae bacterium BrNp21-10]|nr:phage shock protein PspA [Alteromonadaceae bacterium BrNp21-10]